MIIPESHRLGRIPVEEIEGVVSQRQAVAYLADAGDIWVYASAILHASNAADDPTHRRVLHVDYSSARLPRRPGMVRGQMTAFDAVDGSFHRRGSAKERVAD
jgi:ectoine hydroxylase-related dioxygenase (phytanoyl-CoA dioxygenase family)